MDVHFNEINGHIKVADTEAFLTPQMMNRIVAETMRQTEMKDQQRRRLEADTRLRRSTIERPEGVA
jgi:hypothetical protein